MTLPSLVLNAYEKASAPLGKRLFVAKRKATGYISSAL